MESYYLPLTFNTLKFKRTYIKGSRANELKEMKKVMGRPDQNGIYRFSDWYGSMEFSLLYHTDIMKVLYSWKMKIEEIKMIFMIASVISIALFIPTSLLSKISLISSVSLFVVFQVIDTILYFKKRKIRWNHAGIVALSILHIENPNRNLYVV